MAVAQSILDRSVCELDASDLERVTAIDRGLIGRARRRFFEMRFAAARERPADFIHFGLVPGVCCVDLISPRLVRPIRPQGRVWVLTSLGSIPRPAASAWARPLIKEMFKLVSAPRRQLSLFARGREPPPPSAFFSPPGFWLSASFSPSSGLCTIPVCGPPQKF